MYSMMVLIMLSLGKWWFTGWSSVLHCFAYIISITEGIDVSSSYTCTRHTGPPTDSRNIIFSCSILCYSWIYRLYCNQLLNIPIPLIQSFLQLNIQFQYAQSYDSDDFWLLNIQFWSASSDHSEYGIFNSDPRNPMISDHWVFNSNPPNPIIPIIEYSIPIRLIRSFRLLNIQF